MALAAALAMASLTRRCSLLGFFVALISMTAACLMMVFALHPFDGAASLLGRLGSEAMRFMVIGLIAQRLAGNLNGLDSALSTLFACQFAGTVVGQFTVVRLTGSHGFLGVVLLVDLIACAMALMVAELSSLQREAGLSVCAETFALDTSPARLERFSACYGLSPREREVLAGWVAGHASSRIEEDLGISKHTVKTHVQNIYAKTGVKNKQELMVLYENDDRWP